MRWTLIAVGLMLSGCVSQAVLARQPDGDELPDADVNDADLRRDTDDPPEDTEASEPLEIDGEIRVVNSVDNASDPRAFETHFAITLAQHDEPVVGAALTVRSAGGSVVLAGVDGTYIGTQQGYFGSYMLEISTRADSPLSIPLAGPAPHRFSSPVSGTRHRAGQPLNVAWAPSGASRASIETRYLSEVTTADSGSYMVPGAELMSDTGELREDFVRVRRSQTVDVPGASVGSAVRIEVRNEVRFAVDGT